MRALPDPASIGGRLKIERERLGFSQEAFAALVGMTKGAQAKWERTQTTPSAEALATWASMGLDCLYVVTGTPTPDTSAQTGEPLPALTVRQALAMLDPVDRHRLLLDLLAAELRS